MGKLKYNLSFSKVGSDHDDHRRLWRRRPKNGEILSFGWKWFWKVTKRVNERRKWALLHIIKRWKDAFMTKKNFKHIFLLLLTKR